MPKREFGAELVEAIKKAKECGRYFITVSRLEDDLLLHCNETANFPKLDISASLQHHHEDRKAEIAEEIDNIVRFDKTPGVGNA